MAQKTKAPTKAEFKSRYKFTPEEVAALFQVTSARIYQLVGSGKLNGVRFEGGTKKDPRRKNIEILRSGVLEIQAVLRGNPDLKFSKAVSAEA